MDDRSSVRIIRRLFFQLMPVQALAIGLPALNNLLNTFVIGRFLGPACLAAIGFNDPVNSLVSAAAGLLATGSQILCGQHLGRGDSTGIRRLLSTTVLLGFGLGLILTAVAQLFPLTLAHLMGAAGECLPLTANYLRGFSLGIPFSVLGTCLLPMLQLDKDGKCSANAILVMVAVNVSGNFLNALVFHGGIFGVGLSTSAANLCMVLVALPHFIHKSEVFRFSVKDFAHNAIGDIFSQGFPAALAPVCFFVRALVINRFIYALGGTVAMSALTIACNIAGSVGAVVEGGYNGSARLVSTVLVGERDTSSLRDLSKVMIRSAGFLYVIAYAIVFVFAKQLALLLGAEPEHIVLYVLAIRIYNSWYLTNIFKTPPLAIYQAMGESKKMTFFTVLYCTVFPCSLCLLLGNALGLGFLYALGTISEALLIVVFAVFFYRGAHRMPRGLWELTDIPSSLSAPRENRFKAHIETEEETMRASREVIEFCMSKGFSSKRAKYCGLCIEEMCVDTIRNGFVPDKKNGIDLRMIYENGEMSILLRNDRPGFDPTAWLELCAPKDPLRSIGIRMVTKLAREMKYTSTLGMNVLTIKI